ncbi:MAG: hypothetical protein LBL69_01505 [Zoogloeaceae bacterium]|jgi:hypothetical protein|nr:hypothetical protein [Zoogloeaceae bacterium]
MSAKPAKPLTKADYLTQIQGAKTPDDVREIRKAASGAYLGHWNFHDINAAADRRIADLEKPKGAAK